MIHRYTGGIEEKFIIQFNISSGRLQYVQGGALNCGLFFAGPPLSPLGAVSGKISENRWAAA
jgi:hypothetical protein